MHTKLILTLLLASTCAVAADVTKSAVEAEAFERHCTDQQSANICASYDVRNAQEQLKLLQSRENKKLEKFPDKQRRLAAAQDRWEKFIQADCEFQTGVYGKDSGSGYLQRYGRCLESHLQIRIKQMAAYVACEQDGCNPW